MPTPSQLSFFGFATRYDALSHNGDPLESLASSMPWDAFVRLLKPSSAGPSGRRPAVPPLMPC